MAAYTRLCFQQLAGQIRYLAEQWNFAADQRIRTALSIEKQWNLCCVRKWRIVVTLGVRSQRRCFGYFGLLRPFIGKSGSSAPVSTRSGRGGMRLPTELITSKSYGDSPEITPLSTSLSRLPPEHACPVAVRKKRELSIILVALN